MKFQVQMKDPDTLGDAIFEAVQDDVLTNHASLAPDERDAVIEARQEKVQELCNRWFKYGEYLCVEIDTDAGTCTVVQAKG